LSLLRLHFWKYQSIGNDFPIVHVRDVEPTEDDFFPRLAVEMCDRRFGVGGDGLLTVERLDEDRVKMRMFNPDGTEDFCGNGLRCAAVHVHAQGWVGGQFTIEHRDREVSVSISEGRVRTVIGQASFRARDVPANVKEEELYLKPVYWDKTRTIVGTAVTTGSTHVVIPVDRLPEDEEFFDLGPKIENFEIYPERTSVIWTEIVEPDHLKIRIWERGVGETLGCGTGSSAAAANYLRGQSRGGRVQVDNRGGSVFVEMEHWSAPITVEGIAAQVYTGEYILRA